MSVIRVHKNKNFTVMSNTHLRDKNLSLKAKGLLSVMLSLPDSWDYSIAGLCAICKENETAVKSAINELKTNRYVIVKREEPTKENGGRIKYNYEVYEEPQPIQKQDTEKQGIENLGVEFQGVEFSTQLNTNKSNIDLLNTNGLSTDKLNTDIISPTELNTDKSAIPLKGLNTSLSDERKAHGQSKDKWVVTKNHIVSVMDKLGYGELADETQSAIEIFRYYYARYRIHTGNPHPRLNDKTMTDTLRNYIMGSDEVSDHDVDTYEMLIDEHFKNNYGMDIDWSIRHFMTEDVRNKLYCRVR